MSIILTNLIVGLALWCSTPRDNRESIIEPQKVEAKRTSEGKFIALPKLNSNSSVPANCLIKLKNGNILLLNSDNPKLFIPSDNSVQSLNIDSKKIAKIKTNKTGLPHTDPAISLNENEVLVINTPIDIVQDLILYRLHVCGYDNCKSDSVSIKERYNSNRTIESELDIIESIKDKYPQIYEDSKKLSEYKEKYGKYAYIYNLNNNTYEKTGIPHLYDKDETYKLLLKDNKVLIISTQDAMAEIYDPQIGEFSLLPNNFKIIGYHYYFVLSDGNIFMVKDNIPYIYNADTDTLQQSHSKFLGELVYPIQLPNDKIIFISHDNKELAADKAPIQCYDYKTDKISTIGNLLIKNRYGVEKGIRLQDGKILIIWKAPKQDDINQEYRAEIFDPGTGESKLLRSELKYAYEEYSNSAILLDDGRVLISGGKDNFQLYIPKTYKRK